MEDLLSTTSYNKKGGRACHFIMDTNNSHQKYFHKHILNMNMNRKFAVAMEAHVNLTFPLRRAFKISQVGVKRSSIIETNSRFGEPRPLP